MAISAVILCLRSRLADIAEKDPDTRVQVLSAQPAIYTKSVVTELVYAEHSGSAQFTVEGVQTSMERVCSDGFQSPHFTYTAWGL
jgi:hypothetical protein